MQLLSEVPAGSTTLKCPNGTSTTQELQPDKITFISTLECKVTSQDLFKIDSISISSLTLIYTAGKLAHVSMAWIDPNADKDESFNNMIQLILGRQTTKDEQVNTTTTTETLNDYSISIQRNFSLVTLNAFVPEYYSSIQRPDGKKALLFMYIPELINQWAQMDTGFNGGQAQPDSDLRKTQSEICTGFSNSVSKMTLSKITKQIVDTYLNKCSDFTFFKNSYLYALSRPKSAT